MGDKKHQFRQIEARSFVEGTARTVVIMQTVLKAEEILNCRFRSVSVDGLGEGLESWLCDKSGNTYYLSAATDGPRLQVDFLPVCNEVTEEGSKNFSDLIEVLGGQQILNWDR